MILLKKNVNDFDNGIESLKIIQSGEMKLEDVKELQNIFKSNLNKISKGRQIKSATKSILKY